MSNRPDSILLRAALRIHASLSGDHRPDRQLELPGQRWADCLALQRKLQIAQSRRWSGASHRLRHRLECMLVNLQSELEQQSRMFDAVGRRPTLNSVADIVSDLASLDDEFERSQVDLRRRTVSVETDPIILESVPLGRFIIRLEWSRYDDLPDYRVLAVSPQYPASDDSVTHPHVERDTLCEGDGKTAIRAALETGRLLDFFVLVRQVLETYNPSSAYVTLDEWDCRSCSDCGDAVSEDAALACQHCESLLCGECGTGCRICCEVLCYGCLSRCGDCEQLVCRACLNHCPTCQGDYCEHCVDTERRGRHKCRGHDAEIPAGQPGPTWAQTAEADPTAAAAALPTAPASTIAAVQSDRLGEAPVPA